MPPAEGRNDHGRVAFSGARRWSSVLAAFLGAASVATPAVLEAQAALTQAALTGRVFADGDRRPLWNATVTLPALRLSTLTDSLGRYRLAPLPPGEHLVVTHATGYRPDSGALRVESDQGLTRDIVLSRAVVPLGEVRVTSLRPVPAKMRGFEERRAFGIGHFLDRGVLQRYESRQTGDILRQQVPGLAIDRGRADRGEAGKAYAAAGRGARPGCYMDVYIDGALVYNSAAGSAMRFDLNSLVPSAIEGIEVYTGASQIPAQYTRAGSDCGLVLIWTRIST